VFNWFKYRPVEPYTAVCYTKGTGSSPTYVISFSTGSVLLLMLYLRTLLDKDTTELFITANDDYEQQLTT